MTTNKYKLLLSILVVICGVSNKIQGEEPKTVLKEGRRHLKKNELRSTSMPQQIARGVILGTVAGSLYLLYSHKKGSHSTTQSDTSEQGNHEIPKHLNYYTAKKAWGGIIEDAGALSEEAQNKNFNSFINDLIADYGTKKKVKQTFEDDKFWGDWTEEEIGSDEVQYWVKNLPKAVRKLKKHTARTPSPKTLNVNLVVSRVLNCLENLNFLKDNYEIMDWLRKLETEESNVEDLDTLKNKVEDMCNQFDKRIAPLVIQLGKNCQELRDLHVVLFGKDPANEASHKNKVALEKFVQGLYLDGRGGIMDVNAVHEYVMQVRKDTNACIKWYKDLIVRMDTFKTFVSEKDQKAIEQEYSDIKNTVLHHEDKGAIMRIRNLENRVKGNMEIHKLIDSFRL